MKGLIVLAAIVVSLSRAALASGDSDNPLFGYTHLLPSPFTLPAGRLALGTGAAFGVTDFLQIGTDLFRDLYKVYNANLKVSLLSYPDFAAALTGSYFTYNTQDVVVGGVDQKVESI